MPLYKCEICNYSTKLKGQLSRHKTTKKHQEKINEQNPNLEETDHIIQNNPQIIQNNPQIIQNNPQIIQNNPQIIQNNPQIIQNNPQIIQKSFKCEYCPKTFTLKSNKRRHEIHRCKENPNLTYKKDSDIKKLEKEKAIWVKEKAQWKQIKETWEQEKEKLYDQVSQLIDKVGDTNIQNNIILNNYGSEDLSHLTDTFMNKMIGMPYGAIPKMIEMVHFNAEKPENKNIMLPNKKENLLKVFQDNKWVFRNKNETITDLVDSKYNIIDEHFGKVENTPQIAHHVQTSYMSFRKFYDDGDAELIHNLKKECELVLLNNRD